MIKKCKAPKLELICYWCNWAGHIASCCRQGKQLSRDIYPFNQIKAFLNALIVLIGTRKTRVLDKVKFEKVKTWTEECLGGKKDVRWSVAADSEQIRPSQIRSFNNWITSLCVTQSKTSQIPRDFAWVVTNDRTSTANLKSGYLQFHVEKLEISAGELQDQNALLNYIKIDWIPHQKSRSHLQVDRMKRATNSYADDILDKTGVNSWGKKKVFEEIGLNVKI